MAGTWLDEHENWNATWKLEGDWVASRADDWHCLVGRNVARRLQLARWEVRSGCITWIAARRARLRASWMRAAAKTTRSSRICAVVQKLANMTGADRRRASERDRRAQDCRGLRGAVGRGATVVSSAAHPPGDRSGRRAAGPHPPAHRFHGAVDSDPHGAMRAGHDGRAGDGTAQRRGSDEIAGWLDLAHCGIISRRGGRAGRGVADCVGAFLGVALAYWMGLRVFGTANFAALGSFSGDDRIDDRGDDGRALCRCACWAM